MAEIREVSGREASQRVTTQRSGCDAGGGDQDSFADDAPHDLLWLRADRQPDAELARAPAYRKGQHAGHADHGNTSVKMAVLAPIPSAKVSTTVMLRPLAFAKERRANRTIISRLWSSFDRDDRLS